MNQDLLDDMKIEKSEKPHVWVVIKNHEVKKVFKNKKDALQYAISNDNKSYPDSVKITDKENEIEYKGIFNCGSKSSAKIGIIDIRIIKFEVN